MQVNRENILTLLSYSALVGSASLSALSPESGSSVGAALGMIGPVIHSLGGVASNLVASAIGTSASRLRPHRDLIHNHDLVAAIGQTIAQLLHQFSQDPRFRRDRSILQKMGGWPIRLRWVSEARSRLSPEFDLCNHIHLRNPGQALGHPAMTFAA